MRGARTTPARRLLGAVAGMAILAVPAIAGAAGKLHTITVRDMSFGAMPQDLHVGDTIEWVNADIFAHSATATDRSFDVELKPKARARTRLRRPGRVAFVCRYHPGMKGELAVAK